MWWLQYTSPSSLGLEENICLHSIYLVFPLPVSSQKYEILYEIFTITQQLYLHGPIFKNLVLLHLKNHHSKVVNLKFWLNGQAVWMYEANLYVLQLPISY